MEPGTYWMFPACLLNEGSAAGLNLVLGLGRGRSKMSHSLVYRGQVARAQCRASDQDWGDTETELSFPPGLTTGYAGTSEVVLTRLHAKLLLTSLQLVAGYGTQ